MTIWAAILIVLTVLFIICAAFFFGFSIGEDSGRRLTRDETKELVDMVLQEQSKCDDKKS